MRAVIALLAFVSFSQALAYADVREGEWNRFKLEYKKLYDTPKELQLRRQIFLDNKQMIDKHNKRFDAGEESYRMAVNQFADMLPKEFANRMLSSLNASYAKADRDIDIYTTADNANLPSSIDWRSSGAVTPVKNQGSCGSCWAFSAAGVLESQQFLKTRRLISLSEQNLVDCSSRSPYNNNGCSGGWPASALSYVKDNGGIDTEGSYSYQGRQQSCRYDNRYIGAKVSGVAYVKQSEDNLKGAVATLGPISVCIDANHFQFYQSGVYNTPSCHQAVNHAVVVVGYGHDNYGGDYWLVKNSWGTAWGESGYIRMARNRNNQCQIANYGVLPLV